MTATRLFTLFTLFSLLFGAGRAIAQDDNPGGGLSVEALAGTGFTYQGWLRSGGSPVSANCDFQFSLHDAAAAGAQVGAMQPANNVAVAGGRFTVVLNEAGQFGPRAFDGSARWLAIAVRCPAGAGGFTNLTPRQALTAAPLALALPGLRTEANATSPNVVGGHISNTVGLGVVGATIGGGGALGGANSVTNNYGTVSGGITNTASGLYATVGGGRENTASVTYAVVGGGRLNSASGFFAAVGGGISNSASELYATVGGGNSNTASGSGATVGGGQGNTASGSGATVGGGSGNTASSSNATVPGGLLNVASGAFSFAAGFGANAIHDGAFVWASNSVTPISSTVANQFLVRAHGGISLTTNLGGTTGCNLSAGGGTWNCTSDRSAKANFAPVDGRGVLEALAGVPIETWSFAEQDAAVRHMGPMAQDFYAAFGLGQGATTISAVDADGVALAAIQGLHGLVQEQQAENAALRERVAALEAGAARAGGSGQLLLGLLAGAALGVGAYALGRRR